MTAVFTYKCICILNTVYTYTFRNWGISPQLPPHSFTDLSLDCLKTKWLDKQFHVNTGCITAPKHASTDLHPLFLIHP